MSLIVKAAERCSTHVNVMLARAALVCGALALGLLLTGCSSIKQYSIQSYEGPMSTRDLHYLTVDIEH
jgi:hypothetical protein